VGLSNVKAIAAGWNHNLVLRSNGMVAVWGVDSAELGWNLTSHAPTNLSDIAAIAAGALHGVVLRSNGTMVAWGYNQGGETNVPAGLSNVTAIAAGRGYTLALLSDDTVTGWGVGLPTIPPGLTDVKAIAAGPGHALATRQGVLTPLILRQPKSQGAAAGGSVTFSVTAASRREPVYQWQFNDMDIAGGTGSSLTLTNVEASTQGGYRVHVSNGAGSAFSEEAAFVLALPPEIISPTNAQVVWVPLGSNTALTVEATAQGSQYVPLHYNWYRDGVPLGELDMENLILWQMGLGQEGNYWAVVTNIAGTATSAVWTVRALIPGGVGAWGDLSHGLPPSGLTNCIGLRAGQNHVVALTEAGTVVAWGANAHGQTTVPDGLTNIVEAAAGAEHTLALREDGTVVAWGRNDAGQTNVPGDLTNATAIAAGGAHNIALLRDGTVRTWGENIGTAPAGLTDVTAIAAGLDFNVALRANGSVTAWGGNSYGQTNVPPGLSNVVGIAAGDYHALALRSDGRVVAWGANTHGQTNAPATLTNAMAVASGAQFSLALRNDGTVVAWGDNAQGQTDTLTNLPPVKLIAAGGAQALAALFSPLVQYPVEVSKDLLLIYNTNSADSIFVKDYYLAHRPMVGNANVLGIGCTTNETAVPAEFTNQIAAPGLQWLEANPTKHPQYIILFLDIPSRVNTNGHVAGVYHATGVHPSVSVGLRGLYPGFKPYVTHINMRDTNACVAYVNKLATISSAGLSSQVVLSASQGSYGNTNYYFDDNRDQSYGVGPGAGGHATNGVITVNPAVSVFYSVDAYTPHLTNCFNVVGYLCWGLHSSLGANYATNGLGQFHQNSGWYLIQTLESANGQRYTTDHGTFSKWYAPTAFGGTGYGNTPVGAVTHLDEPGGMWNDSAKYFGLWEGGKAFGICAWESRRTERFQAVGDPLVRR
jgi:alpha-tubulin suppressor-like RCC1 family protein